MVGKAVQGLQDFWSGYSRIHERRSLLDRPWEEEFLHFAPDGSLHGHLAPRADARPRVSSPSVTSDGWCPEWAAQRRRA